MNSSPLPTDPSFYTPDVFIYSPFNQPDQPASLTKQLPQKIIPDEYIDLSFLQSIPPVPLSEDNGVLKFLIQEGEPLLSHQDLPRQGAVLHLRYESRRPDGQLIDKFRDRNEIRKVKLGKEGYIEGIMIALSSMRRKEVSWFKFESKYHYYGENMNEIRTTCDGETMVRKDEAIFYKLEVVDYKNMEKLENDDFEGRIKKLEEIRLKGKTAFQTGDNLAAIKIYNKGLGIVKSFPKVLMEALDEEKVKVFQWFHSIMHSNAILCKIRQKKWYEALRLCEDGLEIDAQNTKLLFLKGKCNLHISNYDLANECFAAVLRIEPENRETLEILGKAKQQERNERSNEKEKFRKVFENWNEEEKAENDEKKVNLKRKRIEEKMGNNGRNEGALEIEQQEEEEEEDEEIGVDFDTLVKGMVVDTNDPNNMFNKIKCMELEEKEGL